jgi:phage antirepressor YoqD-like protein
MYRLIITALAIIILVGCESAADREKAAADREQVKVAADREKAAADRESEIRYQNRKGENGVLLAIKYGVKEEKLTEILYEYEMLTRGHSRVPSRARNAGNLINNNEIDVPTALDNLSKKYQIDKKTLVAILMDNKMLNKCPQN